MGLFWPLSGDACRAILESLPIGVYLVDRERRIVLWNDGCERITGYPRHEVIGRCCADNLLMHCDERNELMCGSACPLLATMHDGREREADLFLRHKQGQRVPVRVRAIPVRDESGSITGACECFDEREVLRMAKPLIPLAACCGANGDAGSSMGDHAMLRRLRADLEEYQTSHIPFGVLCMAVDGIDSIRATNGPCAVEKLAGAAYETLARSIGHGNWLDRRAETGFVAILKGCTDAGLLESAMDLKRLVSLDAVSWWGDQLKVTVSAGGTIARAGDTAEELVRRAEGALTERMKTGVDQAVVV